ncbi:hypothetical protein [Paludisphaera sp.]|uniref:hypothetical protein n=1 Tax=Paludisphaera sp. TaxID=2017432 RepID=UPI00301C43BA
MQDRPVRPRDLVIDNHDRPGIVVSRHPRQPGRKWLEEQFDARMRDPGHRIWWKVLPLDGGMVIVPEGLMKHVREATLADALQAVAGANEAAVKTLIGLFPALVEYAKSLVGDDAYGPGPAR